MLRLRPAPPRRAAPRGMLRVLGRPPPTGASTVRFVRDSAPARNRPAGARGRPLRGLRPGPARPGWRARGGPLRLSLPALSLEGEIRGPKGGPRRSGPTTGGVALGFGVFQGLHGRHGGAVAPPGTPATGVQPSPGDCEARGGEARSTAGPSSETALRAPRGFEATSGWRPAALDRARVSCAPRGAGAAGSPRGRCSDHRGHDPGLRRRPAPRGGPRSSGGGVGPNPPARIIPRGPERRAAQLIPISAAYTGAIREKMLQLSLTRSGDQRIDCASRNRWGVPQAKARRRFWAVGEVACFSGRG